MVTVTKEVATKRGEWTNLNWSINVDYTISVRSPRGAVVRTLYGSPWFGWTAKQETLDGENYKQFSVSAGPIPAFVQIKTNQDTWVHFLYTPGTSGPSTHGGEF